MFVTVYLTPPTKRGSGPLALTDRLKADRRGPEEMDLQQQGPAANEVGEAGDALGRAQGTSAATSAANNADEYVRAPELTDAPSTRFTIAHTAMGKTTAVHAALKKQIERNPDYRVLMLSARITFGRSAMADFASLGFVFYQDIPQGKRSNTEHLSSLHRLMFSPESLYKLNGVPAFDALVIDEGKTIAGTFVVNGTLKVAGSINQLSRLWREATHRWVLGADLRLDNAVAEMYAGLRGPKEPAPIWNEYSQKKLKRHVVVRFGQDLLNDIVAAAAEHHGKALVVVVCGSAATAQRYAKAVGNKGFRVKLVSSAIGSKKRTEYFRDIDATLVGLDVLVHTTTLCVGVDPKTTVVGRLFLHTSKGGAVSAQVTQAADRWGRRPGLLLNTTITASVDTIHPAERAAREALEDEYPCPLVACERASRPYKSLGAMRNHCRRNHPDRLAALGVPPDPERKELRKALSKRAPPTTFDRIRQRLRHQATFTQSYHVGSAVAAFRGGLGGVETHAPLPEWFYNCAACNVLERELNERCHWEEFERVMTHRGWTYSVGGSSVTDESVASLSGAGFEFPKDEFFALMPKGQQRTLLVEYILGRYRHENAPDAGVEADEDAAAADFIDYPQCYNFSKEAEDQETAFTEGLRTFYFAIEPYRSFPSSEDYELLIKHKAKLHRYAVAKHGNRAALLRHDARSLYKQSHAKQAVSAEWRLKHPQLSRVADARVFEVARSLAAILDVESIGEAGPVSMELYNRMAALEADAGTSDGARKLNERRKHFAKLGLKVGKDTLPKKSLFQMLQKLVAEFGMALRANKIQPAKRKRGEARPPRRVVSIELAHDVPEHLKGSRRFKCHRTGVFVRSDKAVEWSRTLEAMGEVDDPYEDQTWGVPQELFHELPESIYEERVDVEVLRLLNSVSPFDNDDPSTMPDVKLRKSLLNGIAWVREKLAAVAGNGRTFMTYTQMQVDGVGFARQYAADSSMKPLQTCPRLLRGAISGEFFGDYDIGTAWPTFGVGVAQRMGFAVPTFACYVESPASQAAVRKTLADHYGVTTKVAKLLPLRIFMGGGEGAVHWERIPVAPAGAPARRIGWREEFKVAADVERHPMVDAFALEAGVMREATLKAYPAALTMLESLGGTSDNVAHYNDAGVKVKRDRWSAFSWAIGDLENRSLMSLNGFLTERGYVVGVLCYDGLMVRFSGEGQIPRQVLDEAEVHMLNALCDDLKGVHIRLEHKLMETGGVQAWLVKARAAKQ